MPKLMLNYYQTARSDVSGMTKVPGKTFHWEGFYEGDLNEAKTLKTELNVFEHFNPKLPAQFKNPQFVFFGKYCANYKLDVLNQVENPTFVGMDTMNFWISIKKDALIDVMKKVKLILINEGEAKNANWRAKCHCSSTNNAAMGPEAVVIKHEYGFCNVQ